MIEIAICDDQLPICEEIHKMVTELLLKSDIDFKTHIFTTGKELLEAGIVFDIVFLDIEINEENGLEIAKQYPYKNETKIIIMTSHDEEIGNGYKVKAFRFLTKPVKDDEFIEAVNEAIAEINDNIKIMVFDAEGEKLIHASEILFVEAQIRACGIKTISGYVKTKKTFEKMKQELSVLPKFYSPHRSYIVNMDYITRIDNTDVVMNNGERVKISRGKTKEFKDFFYTYIRGKACGI